MSYPQPPPPYSALYPPQQPGHASQPGGCPPQPSYPVQPSYPPFQQDHQAGYPPAGQPDYPYGGGAYPPHSTTVVYQQPPTTNV